MPVTAPSSAPAPAPMTPPGNLPVDRIEAELLKRNIILSENSSEIQDVRGYMISDPAYMKLSKDVLQLLSGRQILSRVPINVINGKYKGLFNIKFNEYLPPDKYAPGPELEQAIYLTFMERYRAQYPQAQSFNDVVTSLQINATPPPVNPPAADKYSIEVRTDDGLASACETVFSWAKFTKVINNPIGGNLPDLQYKMFFQTKGIAPGTLPSIKICPSINAPGQCWPQDVTVVKQDGSFDLLIYKRQSNNGWHRFVITFAINNVGKECAFTIQ